MFWVVNVSAVAGALIFIFTVKGDYTSAVLYIYNAAALPGVDKEKSNNSDND